MGALAASLAISLLSDSVLGRLDKAQEQRRQEVLAALASSLNESQSAPKPEIAALKEEAGRVVEELLDRFPENPSAWDAIAVLFVEWGKADDAARAWQRSLELDSAFGEAHYRLGLLARDRGEHQAAVDHFRKAIELGASSPALPEELSGALMRVGRPEEAAGILEKEIRTHPRSVATLVLLGNAYGQLKDYEKSRKCYETALEIAPDFSTACHGLATAYARLGSEAKAKQYLEKLKALKAAEEQVHRERLKKADDVAERREGIAQFYAKVGQVYCEQGEPQPAEAYWRKVVQLAPNQAEGYLILAWFFEQQDRPDEAVEVLKPFAEAQRENVAVQVRIGSLYVGLERFEEAEKAFQSALEDTPGQGGGYATLAKLYLRFDRKLPEARRLAAKAVELEPVARNYFTLALVCRRAGDREGARAALWRAVALEPDSAEYRRAYEAVEKGPGK